MRWLLSALFIVFSINSIANIVEFKISKDCHPESMAVVFVSNDENPREYVYQSYVPNNGTVEFNLVPGKYTLEAVTKNLCEFSKSFEFKNKPLRFIASLKEEKEDV